METRANASPLNLARLTGELETKATALASILNGISNVVVAYSGGVDSALLAVFATRTLGFDRVLSATAVSGSLDPLERIEAAKMARFWGLRHTEVNTDEFNDERYLRNDALRCYYCKSSLMDQLEPIARAEGATVVLGVNTDDLGEYRPGQKAAAERGATFPLVGAGFSKVDVREVARLIGLEVWDKPAAPCLSSRLPYGTRVTIGAVSKVASAERSIRELGFPVVRVRHYGELASIEVEKGAIADLALRSNDLERIVSEAGYEGYRIDPLGFRSGSLNEVLVASDQEGV